MSLEGKLLAKALKRWLEQSLAVAVSQWQRSMSEATLLHMHSYLQSDSAMRLLIGGIRRLNRQLTRKTVADWRMGALKQGCAAVIKAGAAMQLVLASLKPGHDARRKALALAAWQQKMSHEDLVNMHIMNRRDTAAVALLKTMLDQILKAVPRALLHWARNMLASPNAKNDYIKRSDQGLVLGALKPSEQAFPDPLLGVPCLSPDPDLELLDAPTCAARPYEGPGSAVASEAALRLEHSASVQLWDQDDQTVYHCIRDARDGYALENPQRIFKFGMPPDTTLAISHVQFGNGCSWLAALVLSNAVIYVAHVTQQGGSILATLIGHSQQISDIAWSKENELLTSISHDGMVRLWSNPTFDCVAVLDLGAKLTGCSFVQPSLTEPAASLVVASELPEPTWKTEAEITVTPSWHS
eukprot:TRINITY_DN7600_c0_g3_i4.p1 TRINITY_DN7600_c0_g3~~TRINITY_DN7600_c0_g3_i4.p1  ORF type:complete len:412 (+),score=94.91 TRINITY_DN7600_c0_g3_i4:212-1447(+)